MPEWICSDLFSREVLVFLSSSFERSSASSLSRWLRIAGVTLALAASACGAPEAPGPAPASEQSVPLIGGGLRGEYFNESNLTAPAFTRTDATVNFDWGAGSPGTGMDADSFSVRWTGTVTPRFSETYTFTTATDDGARLWVNNQLIVDDWVPHSLSEKSGTITLQAGQSYSIRFEYFEAGVSAVARLLWSSPSQPREVIPTSQLTPPGVTPTGGLKGEYFNETNFTAPAFTRTDATVNFDWGAGSPGTGMDADSFSVRWTGTVTPRFSETYTFTTATDDGARLWVNNQLLVDDWIPHSLSEKSGTITLQAGQAYSIRFEYFEAGVGAVARLFWSSPSQPREIIPSSQLSPGTVTPPPPPPQCTLTASGPVTVTRSGQVVENLRITSTSGPAIRVNGFTDVVIRNVEILYSGAHGIDFSNAHRLRIENVSIRHTGAPASGPNSSPDRNNINGYGSQDVVITRARLEKGSSGIFLIQSPRARLSFIEGHDFRGPFPRGQLAQFGNSPDGLIEDFSAENPPSTSWPEDIISFYQSPRGIARRGLVDGNNSVSGVGVMFELSDGSAGGLAEDVDAIRQGNGAFSAYPGRDVTFRRVRVRDQFCTDQGRGAPASGGLSYGGAPGSTGLRIEDSVYYNVCPNTGIVWDRSTFTFIGLREESFVPRAPQRLTFCWQN